MSHKRARHGSATADAGKHEGEEHVVCKEAGTSATVHSENEAERTNSYYEWVKTAKGFKRRRIGAQGWTVCLFLF